MSMLPAWLTKPRTTVRIDTSLTIPAWMRGLRRSFVAKPSEDRARIEVLDRLSLGGKKSLVLVSIEGQRLLVGVGEDAAPSISSLESAQPLAAHGGLPRMPRSTNRRRLGRA